MGPNEWNQFKYLFDKQKDLMLVMKRVIKK